MANEIKDMLKELYKLEKKARTENEELSMEEVGRYEYLRSFLDEKAQVLWDDFQKETIEQRYFEGKRWGEIADNMGVLTEDHVRKASERGIARMQEVFEYEKKEKEIEKNIKTFMNEREEEKMLNEIKTTDLKECVDFSIKIGFTDTEFEEWGKASQLFVDNKNKEILLIAQRGISA